jgi:hypothetical protein
MIPPLREHKGSGEKEREKREEREGEREREGAIKHSLLCIYTVF